MANAVQTSLKEIRNLLFFSHIRGKPVVVIDGGLGNQILGWIKYHTAIEFGKIKNSKEQTRLDLEYFCNPPQNKKGLSYFDWELSEYGIKLENLKSTKRPLLFQFSYNHQARNERHLYQLMNLRSWAEYFPLTESYFKLNEKLELSKDYVAIHLRRGDYLNVAARIVTVDEVCSVLNRISSLIPTSVLVLSDSEISDEDFRKILEQLPDKVVRVIVGGDTHAIHGILRQAKFLITSNSAFSLSAALTMTNNGLAVAPRNFHGSKNSDINEAYHLLSSWTVI